MKNSRAWIKDGCIGIIIAVILDIIIFAIVSGPAMKCVGDVCGPTALSSTILTPIVSLLIWPAAVLQASLWRIAVLGVYYFAVGVILGLIYRFVRKQKSSS